LGVFGGGGGGGGAAAIPAVKAAPPPAQMSASLQAVRNARGMTDGGDLGGTILTGGSGADIPGAMVPKSPADLLYGKKLTGA